MMGISRRFLGLGKVNMGAVCSRAPLCFSLDSGPNTGTLTLASLVLAVGFRPSWKGASEAEPFLSL